MAGSLSDRTERSDLYWVRVATENLVELLGRPTLWPHVGTMMSQLRGDVAWPLADVSDDPALVEVRVSLLRASARLAELGRQQGLSAFPLLTLLHKAVKKGIRDIGSSGFFLEFEARLRELAAAGSIMTERDVEVWLLQSADLPRAQNIRSARKVVLRWLYRCKLAGKEQRSWAELLRLSVPFEQHAWEGRWQTGSRLERFLGRRATGGIMRLLERLRPVESSI